jgi:hypothetical protein
MAVHDGVVEGGYPVVVELGGDGAEDRHLLGRAVEGPAVALDLLAYVLHGIVAAAFSNLLTATRSAKSSMSIFSSWEAAPYSLVMT